MTARIRRPGDFFADVVGRPLTSFLCLTGAFAAIEKARGHKLAYTGSAGVIPAVSMGSTADINRRIDEEITPNCTTRLAGFLRHWGMK